MARALLLSLGASSLYIETQWVCVSNASNGRKAVTSLSTTMNIWDPGIVLRLPCGLNALTTLLCQNKHGSNRDLLKCCNFSLLKNEDDSNHIMHYPFITMIMTDRFYIHPNCNCLYIFVTHKPTLRMGGRRVKTNKGLNGARGAPLWTLCGAPWPL